ncbi:hypothetical protein BBH88_04595 [Planococcus antarcticus DSM 14505]|uniref:Transposase n=1 Tax=Planococcus antarcticus DSM 14505 TaxID=1185653 RepID=A0ABM6D289_9BACL|nr:hypothetical protein [Planococcus antarcticus]ANU09624.1 hypothetical protein BBH88_04595 [Planococcus antarcticus DSM 14505]
MSHPYEGLQEKCRTLRLAETAKELPNFLREAESKGWTYHEFIHEVLSYEMRCRAYSHLIEPPVPYFRTTSDKK